jgi:hypothetical protein
LAFSDFASLVKIGNSFITPDPGFPGQAWHSADVAPYDFWLFLKLKTPLKGSHFDRHKDIIQNVMAQLHTVPKHSFQKCFQQWKDNWAKSVCVTKNLVGRGLYSGGRINLILFAICMYTFSKLV